MKGWHWLVILGAVAFVVWRNKKSIPGIAILTPVSVPQDGTTVLVPPPTSQGWKL